MLLAGIASVRRGGTVTQVGIFEQKTLTLPAAVWVTRELTYTGCQSYNFDFAAAIDLAPRIDLKKLVTHTFPLSKIQEAFDAFNDPDSGAIKILLYPDW
jgi:threonine dehydrogenase-like Zn-dependent dehydrogenase